MKNLKIKFGIFSLLAILAVSVFLTACEEENIVPETLEEVSIESSVLFTLPDKVNKLSDKKIIEYLQSLSDEDIDKLSIEVESGELESECGWKVHNWKIHNWKALHIKCKVTKWGCESTDSKRKYIYEKCGKNYRRTLGDCCYR